MVLTLEHLAWRFQWIIFLIEDNSWRLKFLAKGEICLNVRRTSELACRYVSLLTTCKPASAEDLESLVVVVVCLVWQGLWILAVTLAFCNNICHIYTNSVYNQENKSVYIWPVEYWHKQKKKKCCAWERTVTKKLLLIQMMHVGLTIGFSVLS